ncbi:N-ethylmaleimide reductase, partial [Morganella morganii]
MSQKKLFTPLKVGAFTAPNRVFMAPLTRLRSIEPGDIPTPLMGRVLPPACRCWADYLGSHSDFGTGQRLCRCTGAAQSGTDCGLEKITAGVHDAGGHIAVQLWHTGR